MTYSPGPWTADHADGGVYDYYGVFDVNGGAICYLAEPMSHPFRGMAPLPAGEPGEGLDAARGAVHKANAELLAAAPELARLLHLAFEFHYDFAASENNPNHWTRQAQRLLTSIGALSAGPHGGEKS